MNIKMTTESGFVCDEYPDEFIKFDKEAINLCETIMRNSSKNKGLSVRLKLNWEKNSIIEVDAMYDEVVQNKVLMKTLLKYMGQGLPDTTESSNYGMGYLSDHSLYFNGSTDTKLNNLIAHLNLPHTTVVELQRKRNKLSLFVRTTRNNVLDNMELTGK
jgi:hypothetical protein